MGFKFSKLRGRIIEKYRTYTNFCEEIGAPKSMVSKKLNGKLGFTYENIVLWCEKLDIPISEVGEYFFYSEVKSK